MIDIIVIYLAVIGGFAHVYLLAWSSLWSKGRARPVLYEVPPGFYRVARDQVVIPRSSYVGLVNDRERLRQLRERVGRASRGRVVTPPKEDWSYE